MQTTRLLLPFLFLPLFASCSADEPAKAANPPVAQPSSDPGANPGANLGADLGAEVTETMNSGGYTYLNLEKGGKSDWYAVPQCAVKVGERVTVLPGAMPMQGFRSETLGRTFDTIYFAQGVRSASGAAPDAGKDASKDAAMGAVKDAAKDPADDAAKAVQQAHDMAKKAAPAATPEFDGIETPEGGTTVAEIWAQGAADAGKEIKLRGKVVKYNGGILGKNWLHVRDGSGIEGSNDITITTDGEAKVGDTVLVTGKVSADRDFGAGYVYALLIEDAKIVIE